VLAEVAEEGVDRLGDLPPELAVDHQLRGMVVEAVMLAVEDARAEIGELDLSDALERVPDLRVGVRDRRAVPVQ
jgi:hypothetical protein